jgi:glycosyltransferase involved in cell wall biosynthesis
MLPSFYSSADFAIWPGHNSVSIVEAMSTGLPVIIPESKWIDHLLKYENGFSYPEGDVAELRKRICILLNNVELRREMGRRSRELVEKELNWNTIAEQYLNAYNSVMEKRPKL